MPIVRLQQQTIMPFIMQQQLHMPPASIVHRFCTMLQAILSSQEQVIFMPPEHFSIFMVQRGTIIMLGGKVAGVPRAGVPVPGAPIPGSPMAVRSIIIAVAIPRTPFLARPLPPDHTEVPIKVQPAGLVPRS
jgi:hypothetical protein